MSPAKRDLLELLRPFFEEKGYKLSLYKSTFVKKENGFEYYVMLKFDGRGGLTSLSWIDYYIRITDLDKQFRKLTGIKNYIHAVYGMISWFSCDDKVIIPPMHSQKAVDIANDMNFKELAKLSYEEKYPRKRIEYCAKVVRILIDHHVFTFFERYNSLEKIYEVYANKSPNEGEMNPLSIENGKIKWPSPERILYAKLLAAKLHVPEPELIKTYKNFYKDFKDGRPDEEKVKTLKKTLISLGLHTNYDD